MKISYLSFAEKLGHALTSFNAIMCYFMAGLILITFSMLQENEADQKQNQINNAICYSRGQVIVSTDAGKRCVAPQMLGLVK